MLQLFLSAYRKVQEKITWTGVLKVDFSCFLFMRQYFNKNRLFYLKKNFLTSYYRVPWPSQFPIVGLTLSYFYDYHLSFQWANSETLIRRLAMESSPASDQTLHCLVMSIGYVRSYRDGDRIFQNSLVFTIFCYSFDNRFILSFLGNHYSLTFHFGSFLMVIRICRSKNLLWSVFPCNGSMSVYTTELVLIHEACTIAFTKLGGPNMIAHAKWPLCLPFPHINLFYDTLALLRGHLLCQFSVSSAMRM